MTIYSIGKSCGKTRHFHTLLVRMQTDIIHVEVDLAKTNKITSLLTFCPAISLLGIYPKDILATISKLIYTGLIIAALFVIAK